MEITPAPRLTPRGAATRDRIIDAASDLMFTKGVAVTTLDEVLAASAASKSQLYQHFPDKAALVVAVIDHQGEALLERQRLWFGRIDSLRALKQWTDAIVQRNVLRRGSYGCELGSLVSELADRDEAARSRVEGYLQCWAELIEGAVQRMIDNGVLGPDADSATLALGMLASIQGGYLLAQASRDPTKMRVSLDIAFDHISSFATS